MVRKKKLITKINEGNYEQEVILSVKPYIILLTAPFCDPGGAYEKMIEGIAKEYEDIVNVGTVNVMQQRELTDMFEIESAPTLIMMTGGVVDIRMPGLAERDEIVRVMELDRIREQKQKGFNYHPPRNFVPQHDYSDEELAGNWEEE